MKVSKALFPAILLVSMTAQASLTGPDLFYPRRNPNQPSSPTTPQAPPTVEPVTAAEKITLTGTIVNGFGGPMLETDRGTISLDIPSNLDISALGNRRVVVVGQKSRSGFLVELIQAEGTVQARPVPQAEKPEPRVEAPTEAKVIVVKGEFRNGVAGPMFVSDKGGTFTLNNPSNVRIISNLKVVVTVIKTPTGYDIQKVENASLVAARERAEREASEKSSKVTELVGKLILIKNGNSFIPSLQLKNGEIVALEAGDSINLESLNGKTVTAKVTVKEDGGWKLESATVGTPTRVAKTCKGLFS